MEEVTMEKLYRCSPRISALACREIQKSKVSFTPERQSGRAPKASLSFLWNLWRD
jgi:hypothetical protein